MINFATFFQDRPRIVSWAVIILAVDGLWSPVHRIVSGNFSILSIFFGIVIPLYLIHAIAEGKPTARVTYAVYLGIFYLLALVIFSSMLPQMDAVMAILHPGASGFVRFLLWIFGFAVLISPKIAAYLMLYSKESNKWFDQGAAALGAKPLTSLNGTIEKH